MALTLLDSNTISALAASVSALVAALALIGASLQVYFLKQQLRQDLDWKQREKALLFSPVYHDKVQNAFGNIERKLASLHRQAPLALDELNEIIAQDKTIKDDMGVVLIYLESIGLAVLHNVADFELIYDSLGTEVIRFCETFSEYIEKAHKRNPRAWKNINYLKARCLQERDRLGNTPIATR
jgi:hypothetical protein